MATTEHTDPEEPGESRPGAAEAPSSERWRRIEEVFHQVLEAEPQLRAGLLEEACGDDGELRREVESLLAASASDDDLLGSVVSSAIEMVVDGDGKNDAEGAEALYQRALGLRRDIFGDDSLAVVETLNDLGEMYTARDRLDAAEDSFRRVLDHRIDRLGDDHPDVADALNNLAVVLLRRRDFAAAEELFRRELALSLRIFGGEHPKVAVSLNNLATALQAQKRHDEAAPLMRQALAIYEQRLGPEHSDTVTGMTNLAFALQAGGERDEAETLFETALARAKQQFGEQHPTVAWILFRLAAFIAEVDPGAAEPHFEQALAVQRQVSEPGDSRIAITLIRLARLRAGRGDHAGAEPLLREAVEIRRQALPAGDPALVAAEYLLRDSLAALGRDQSQINPSKTAGPRASGPVPRPDRRRSSGCR